MATYHPHPLYLSVPVPSAAPEDGPLLDWANAVEHTNEADALAEHLEGFTFRLNTDNTVDTVFTWGNRYNSTSSARADKVREHFDRSQP